MKSLKKLAVDHPYYASESNYYSNDASREYDCWEDFYSEYGNADVDMNLCYRWDIYKDVDENDKETGRYGMKIFIIGQRKGLYKPCIINEVTEDNVPQIIEYLTKHHKTIIEIWKPFN